MWKIVLYVSSLKSGSNSPSNKAVTEPPFYYTTMVVSSRLWSRSLNKEDESSSLKACNSINSLGKKTLKSLASVDVRIRLIFSVCPISFMKVKTSSFLDLTLILEHYEQYSSPRGPEGSTS